MKMRSILLMLGVSTSGLLAAVDWPMPKSLPVPPPGVNSATYPEPRQDWLARFQGNLDKSRPLASSIELVFDGDSITDGWQGKGLEVWNARYGKLHPFDFGISGDRTQHVLWRLDQSQVDGIKPKLIALMIGTNNLSTNTDEEIAAGVKAVVEDYQKRCPDAVVLLQAIFPRGNSATDPLRARIKNINTMISKLGDDKKVIYVDFGDKFLQPDGTLSADIMPDFLHPNAKGYQIWADAIQPVIDKYFPPAAK